MITLRKIKISHQRQQGIIINYNIPPPKEMVGDLLTGNTPHLKSDKDKSNVL